MGQTKLISGEIAEDLTYYFASSEQIPSVVALGVLMNKDNTVKRSGGLIIQLMPFADDTIIDRLEQKVNTMSSITSMLDNELTPEMILEEVLGDFGLDILDKIPVAYECNCSKQRVEKAIISIGHKDIQEMIDDNKPIEVNCHFCNKHYEFTVDELKEMLNRVQ